ncbi:MAG: hypothetical protein UV70_C0015G0002 [Parcubacteria group bacterium GW2011_GWA2_43_13]|nr:MAG: hypothetical protein UV70_C0015G0002 [Parcubacteria group bacterium GW2011_GWA2_43_13]MBS3120750.1 hypothetical protein [Candidatus Woesearchaeota archaeon]
MYSYNKFKKTKLWEIMDKGIDDLVNNKDIEENTQRAYIVGYLCKLLHETGHENAESKDEKYS